MKISSKTGTGKHAPVCIDTELHQNRYEITIH